MLSIQLNKKTYCPNLKSAVNCIAIGSNLLSGAPETKWFDIPCDIVIYPNV